MEEILVMIWGDIDCLQGLTGGAGKPPGSTKGMPLTSPYGWFWLIGGGGGPGSLPWVGLNPPLGNVAAAIMFVCGGEDQ